MAEGLLHPINRSSIGVSSVPQFAFSIYAFVCVYYGTMPFQLQKSFRLRLALVILFSQYHITFNLKIFCSKTCEERTQTNQQRRAVKPCAASSAATLFVYVLPVEFSSKKRDCSLSSLVSSFSSTWTDIYLHFSITYRRS